MGEFARNRARQLLDEARVDIDKAMRVFTEGKWTCTAPYGQCMCKYAILDTEVGDFKRLEGDMVEARGAYSLAESHSITAIRAHKEAGSTGTRDYTRTLQDCIGDLRRKMLEAGMTCRISSPSTMGH